MYVFNNYQIKLFTAIFGKPECSEGPIIVSLSADTGCGNTSKHSAQLLSGHFNHPPPNSMNLLCVLQIVCFLYATLLILWQVKSVHVNGNPMKQIESYAFYIQCNYSEWKK